MIQIKFNQELFDKHIKEISKSIKKLIDNKLKSKLLVYEKDCLTYINDNLENILKADEKNSKKYIEHFKSNYKGYTIGVPNQKEKNWKGLYKILRKDIFEKEYDNWSNRVRCILFC